MSKKGLLYVIATPIGNLGDISKRAIETLEGVGLIVAEDTRHTQKLLNHLGIRKKTIALYDHNERMQADSIVHQILAGETCALVSDAGTPLISDPGFHLVRLAQENKITVIPIPGPSALIAALSVSGLPTDRFVFEGFLPEKSIARQNYLETLANEERTLVFYEAPHRIQETLEDVVKILGGEREAVLARELTKTFETIQRSTLQDLLDWILQDVNQQRGEIVLLVAGFKPSLDNNGVTPEALLILKILLEELPLKQAAHLASKISGVRKRSLYDLGLKLKKE